MKKLILSICLLFALSSMAQQPIDRKKVVERNNSRYTAGITHNQDYPSSGQ